jgi:hypothetical protein
MLLQSHAVSDCLMSSTELGGTTAMVADRSILNNPAMTILRREERSVVGYIVRPKHSAMSDSAMSEYGSLAQYVTDLSPTAELATIFSSGYTSVVYEPPSIADAERFSPEVLDWEFVLHPSRPPVSEVTVTLHFAGRVQPLPFDDIWVE